ncbi:MAG TPA: TetR/AcrR family transcriptional regulator [Phenylobacterium sp.]
MTASYRSLSHEVAGVRAKALAAASEILATQGVDELNLRAIAESAGIGISSMYHYFANKEELLLSLALMGFEDLRGDIVRLQETFPASLAAGARAYLGFAEARPALFSVMFSERLLARHDALREAERETLLVFQAAVETDDRFPAEQRANVAMVLWTLGRGMAAVISSYPGGEVPQDLVAKFRGGFRYLISRE